MSDTTARNPGTDKKNNITIFINTRSFEIPKKEELTFDEVIALAFPEAPSGTNVAFSVMYERAHGNAEGTLVSGQTVKVKEGMRFDVTPTDRS